MPVYVDCQICGTEFSVPKCREKTAKACSKECAVKVRALSNRRQVKKTCPECGQVFEVPQSHKDRRTYCSYKCRDTSPERLRKAALARAGDKNPMWKQGFHTRRDGYVYELAPLDHHFRSPNGYVLQHRLVMERYLVEHEPSSSHLVSIDGGLYLRPELHVHHIDEDKANNRLENLICVSAADHRKLHRVWQTAA